MLAHLAQLAEAQWHRDLRRRGCIPPTAGCFRCSATRASPSRSAPSRACSRSSCRPAGAGGDRPLRGARPDRRRGRSAPRPRAFLDRGDRRLAAAGERRRDGRPQTRGRRVRRADLSDQPARQDHRRPASLRIHRRRPRTRGPGRHRVPAPLVVEAARACAPEGVRALVVLSAGFGEDGPDGVARQAELLGICRETGMRLVGPNCLGVLNTAPAVHMNATFAPGRPPAGRIAFASQSGAYGIAALNHAERWGLGLSSFVSMGNKADLSGNDFLRFWEQDAGTDAVLLYLEALGQPAALRPDLPEADRLQAGDRRQERAQRRGAARRVVAYRRSAPGLGGDGRRALRPRGRHPRRDPGRAARRRRAARAPAAAARRPRGDRHQCRRTGDLLRRCRHGGRPAGRAAHGGHPPGARRSPAACGGADEPGRHARRRHERGLPPDDRGRGGRPWRRRDHRDLPPGAAGARRGRGAARHPCRRSPDRRSGPVRPS